MVVYEQLKSELLADSDLFSYSSDARTWMEKVPVVFLLPMWQCSHHREGYCLRCAFIPFMWKSVA